jgi:hypothetical protein
MSSVTTKTSPFKDIPSGVFAKGRTFSEQRASDPGKKELTTRSTPLGRYSNLTSGLPSGPHEFLSNRPSLGCFDAARQCRRAEKTGSGRRRQKGRSGNKSPAKAGLFKFWGVQFLKQPTAVNVSFVKTAGMASDPPGTPSFAMVSEMPPAHVP